MSLIKQRLEKLHENSPFNWTGRVHLGRKWAVFWRTGRVVCVTWCALHYRPLIRWPFLLKRSSGQPAIVKHVSALIDGEFVFFCLLCSFLFMSVGMLMLFLGLVVLPHPHFLITSLPFKLSRSKMSILRLFFFYLTNKVVIQFSAASLSEDDESPHIWCFCALSRLFRSALSFMCRNVRKSRLANNLSKTDDIQARLRSSMQSVKLLNQQVRLESMPVTHPESPIS